MTQADLADASGVSLRSISNLERGHSTRPRRDTLEMMADALGLDAQRRKEFLAAGRGWRIRHDSPPPPERPTSELPRFPGAFIGRDSLLADTLRALSTGAMSIITLTGPGGVGKTRLAAEAARASPFYGLRLAGWVPLDTIAAPALVLPTAEEFLRIPNHRGGAPLLLVLDNFEHLAAAASGLPALIARVPNLRLLVTSRAPLGLRAERVIPVLPLDGPQAPIGPGQSGWLDLESPALELFTRRARDIRPELHFDGATVSGRDDLAAAAAICRSLDGLPLAIELAAGQLASFSLPALRAWLDRSGPAALGSSGPDRASRQRSLDDAFAWSYDLLDAADQTLLRRLAVFSGGFTLGAAETVISGAARSLGEPPPVALPQRIAHLAAVNLLSSPVLPEGSEEPRVRMLELIRSSAQERLDALPGEAAAVRLAHLAWVRTIAGRWQPGMSRSRLNAWLDELERERGNLRAAITWATKSGRAAEALALAADLGRLCDLRDLQHEGMAWLEAAVAAGEAADPPVPVPPLAWYWMGTLAIPLGDPDRCREMGARLTALAADNGKPEVAARGAILTSLWQSERGDHAAATATALAGIAATEGVDESLPGNLLVVRARLFSRLAVAAHTEADALAGTPDAAYLREIARDAYLRSLRLSEVVADESGMINALAGLGVIATDHGDAAAAERSFRQGMAIAAPNRHWWYVWLLLLGQAAAAAKSGNHPAAARLLGAAAVIGTSRGFLPYAFWRSLRDGAEEAVRAALDPDDYAAEAAAGRRAAIRAGDDAEALDRAIAPKPFAGW